MTDAEAPAATPQAMGVPQVLELFDQQITAFSANVESARVQETVARGALEIATEELRLAQQARDARAVAHRQAELDILRSERWLEDGRNAAIAALHTLDVPASETFLGQTRIEGKSEEDARDAIGNVRRLNEALSLGDKNRLIVLGSFPVKAALLDGDQSSYNRVSIVDLSPVGSAEPSDFHIGLERAKGSHFLRVSATRVTQIPFNPLTALRETQLDATKHDRYVNASPLDVRVVTTEEELAELTHQGLLIDEVPKRYGAITVGTEEGDSFPPTVIAGEAAGKFTEWLARNEWMRTMIYVATVDENGQAEHVPELHEDTEQMAQARDAFRQSLLFQANRMTRVWGRSDEEEAVAYLHNEPLLSAHVQDYLGISDEMITEWLIEGLISDVSVETPSRFDPPSLPVQFKVDNHSQLGRHFTSVEQLCDFIGQHFKAARFDLGDLQQVAKGIQIELLEQKLEHMRDDTRADRKLRAKVSAALEAVRAA